jgi:hypothetical protein
MAPGLRKLSGKGGPEGAYTLSGTLVGLDGPGRRTVRWLELRNLQAAENLSVLRAFPELRRLDLLHVQGLDLSPLRGLALQQLQLQDASDIDLAPIAELALLEGLSLINIDRISAPSLRLSGALRMLTIINDDPDLTGGAVKSLVEAIEWERLGDLKWLALRVGGLHVMRPIQLDLGFLRSLPKLESLTLSPGIDDAGRGTSPLEPPFDGLPRTLRRVHIQADHPERVEAELKALLHIGPPSDAQDVGVWVNAREPFEEPTRPWTILGPDDGIWTTYGSLSRAEAGAYDDTEYDACSRALRRVQAVDPALADRLDFDPENAGTGISAQTRDDLETALSLLNLNP